MVINLRPLSGTIFTGLLANEFPTLPWYINVEQAGTYTVEVYFHDKPAATPVFMPYCAVEADGKTHVQQVYGRASHCRIIVELNKGKQRFGAWFSQDAKGASKDKSAFYVYVEKHHIDSSHTYNYN